MMRAFVIGVATTLLLVPLAFAADQPLTGRKVLLVKRASGAEKVVFLSRDTAVMAPTPGGPDDPTTVGATVELFAATDAERGVLGVPAGAGKIGWTVGPTTAKYANRDAPGGPWPVRAIALKGGARLKVVARAADLALDEPRGAVGIRVTMGSTRYCALFDGPSVRRDEPGRFLAQGALAPAGCDTETLGGVVACGDGVVDAPEECECAEAEPCDTGDPFGSRCMPAGVDGECSFCSDSTQIYPCCGPAIVIPFPSLSKSCHSTSCEPPWTCPAGNACVDGACCTEVGATCHFFNYVLLNPCCDGSVCERPATFGLVCCVPTGGPCTDDAECCSNSCGAGLTCD